MSGKTTKPLFQMKNVRKAVCGRGGSARLGCVRATTQRARLSLGLDLTPFLNTM